MKGFSLGDAEFDTEEKHWAVMLSGNPHIGRNMSEELGKSL
jgi:hypothetical protein